MLRTPLEAKVKIHEYQAKELLKARGIAVPDGHVARTVEEAVAAVRPLVEASGNPVVVLQIADSRGRTR